MRSESTNRGLIEQLYLAERRVHNSADLLWQTIVQPMLDKCQTEKDVVAVMGEVSRLCADEDNQIRELPSDWSVRFILEQDRARQKARNGDR